MRKFVTLFAAGAVCALVLNALSLAATRTTVWTSALSSGQELPRQVVKDTAAHGLFKATLSGKTLKWKLTFAKLTGRATAAHIHMAAKGKSGNVVVPLCGPCHSGVTGTATVTAVELSAFKKHLLYVNVHTAKNPNGEIRGQLASGKSTVGRKVPNVPKVLQKLTIATVATNSGAQGFLGKEKSFFTASGLDVNVKIVAGVPELAAAVASGQAQLALTSPASVASAHVQGIDFKIVAPGTRYTYAIPGTLLMVSNKATSITSVKNLAGKTIAVNAFNTLPHLSTLALLDDAGIDTSKVNFVKLDFPAIGQAIESGQVDVGVVVTPYVEQQEAANISHPLTSPYNAVNHGQPFLETVWFGKGDYIANNAETITKFRSAIANTSAWANNPANSKERKRILEKYAGMTPGSLADAQLEGYGIKVLPGEIQPIIDLQVRFGALKSTFKAEDIIAAGSGS